MKRKLTPKSNLSQQQLQQQPLSLGRIMIAGSFGGFCYWTCCYPLDVIKSRIQNDLAAPTRIFPVAQSIMTEGGGVKALFRGYGTTILRSLPAGKYW